MENNHVELIFQYLNWALLKWERNEESDFKWEQLFVGDQVGETVCKQDSL